MGIYFMVVNDDLICREIVSKILECCRYRELCTGRLMDALNALWANKNEIYLVLTNLHRLGEKGVQLINQIRHKYQAEIIYLRPDDKKIEWKGDKMSYSVYHADVSNIDDLNKLWEFAFAREKAAPSQEGTSAQPSEARLESFPLVGDGSGIYKQRKRKEPTEKIDASGEYCPSIFFSGSTFELESFLVSLDGPVEENIPGTSGKPAIFSSPSPPLSQLPTRWNSNPKLPANFLHPELPSPPLLTSGNVNSLQYPSIPPSGASMDGIAGPSLTTFTPWQEISFPLLRTSGNGTSGQEPSTSTYQIPLQESPMPQIEQEPDNFQLEEYVSAFFNETESSSP